MLILKSNKHAADRETTAFLTLLNFFWIAPLAAGIIMKVKVYNSWRHLFFIYGPMVLIATYGASMLFQKLKRGRKFAAALLCGVILIQVIGIIQNHPNQYAYYNFLAGRHLENTMELDYWRLSTKRALEDLFDIESRDKRLSLTVGDLCSGEIKQNLSVLSNSKKDQILLVDIQEANYLIANTTSLIRCSQTVPNNYKEIYSQYSYGNKILAIFERQY